MSPQINSPAAPLFLRIKGAEEFRKGNSNTVEGLVAVDKYVLKIILKEPYAPFLAILAMHNAKAVPKEEIEKEKGILAIRPVGTGAFRFMKWKPGEELIIEANESYFEGRPYLDKVIYKIYPGAQTEITLKSFLNGELGNSRIPSKDRETILKKYFRL